MSSSSPPKKKKKKEEEEEDDRFSKLPNEVIHRIFSVIDMKHVIPISLVCKKLRSVWISSPFVNLNNEVYEALKSPAPYKRDFTDFVTHLLFVQDRDITSFKLSYNAMITDIEEEKITDEMFLWISRLVCQKLETLELRISSYQERLFLPTSLFSCQYLKFLKLDMTTLVVEHNQPGRKTRLVLPTTTMSLPALKTMELSCLLIQGGLLRLVSAAPNLEIINIQRCGLLDEHHQSPNLIIQLVIAACPKLSAVSIELEEIHQ